MRTAAATRIRKPNLVMLCAQAFSNISGYVPGSDVTEHNKIDLDQSAMEAALGAANFSGATHYYSNGGFSTSKGKYRTLQGFSTGAQEKMYDGCPGCPYKHYKQFYNYYGDYDYADKWVSAALGDASGAGTDMAFTSGKHGPNAFSTLGDAARKEAVKKGTAYIHTCMYAEPFLAASTRASTCMVAKLFGPNLPLVKLMSVPPSAADTHLSA